MWEMESLIEVAAGIQRSRYAGRIQVPVRTSAMDYVLSSCPHEGCPHPYSLLVFRRAWNSAITTSRTTSRHSINNRWKTNAAVSCPEATTAPCTSSRCQKKRLMESAVRVRLHRRLSDCTGAPSRSTAPVRPGSAPTMFANRCQPCATKRRTN